MALTDQQLADVRRYAGYPQVGANHTVDASRDFSYGWTLPGVWETLESILTNLRPENETTLINIHLANLATLEQAIYGTTANQDTAVAGIWTRNPQELAERKSLYRYARLELCSFLGVAPGPMLQGGNTVTRS